MNKRRLLVWLRLGVAAALLLAIWAMLVWVSSRPALKALIDLTPQRTNSVDATTVELLRDLRQQQAKIELHLFYLDTRGAPQNDVQRAQLRIRTQLVQRTQMLLRSYQHLGGEAVRVYEHQPYGDPQAYSEAAQRFGYNAQDGESLVVAVTMPGKEPRHLKLSLVSDLAVIDLPSGPAGGGGPVTRQPVPVLKDYQGEVAISSALKSLLVQGTPKAYVLKGYSPTADYGVNNRFGYGALLTALIQLGFEVTELNLRDTQVVPADADLVLVLEPTSEFAPRDAEALFEYLRRGGRMFVNYGWSPAASEMNPTGGRFGELLGYEVSDRPIFHLIPQGARTGGQGLDGNDAVKQVPIRRYGLHPTTRRLAESGRPFEVMMARALRQRPGSPAGVNLEELLLTGDQAWLAVPDASGTFSNRRPNIQLQDFVVAMACEVARPGDDAAAAADARPGEIVIVSGIFCNNALMEYFGNFALNVCNWLVERRVLLDIGGTRYDAKYLDVKQPQLDSAQRLQTVYVPGAFLLLGLIVWWRRRH